MRIKDMNVGELFCNGTGSLFCKISPDEFIHTGKNIIGINSSIFTGRIFPISSNMEDQYTICDVINGKIEKRITFSSLNTGDRFTCRGIVYEKILPITLKDKSQYNSVKVSSDSLIWLPDDLPVEKGA